ncbi:hypothetical protein jaqu_01680 [Jannaschia aquimarina]|uniref:Uncharacterized protein n=1 Tax=Jannaschia aquimarina TaxID=935700 RepID=A0A0D1DDH4_9RHOB|nr:hypothetical protein jaqu_01680 [Jannaschia aquimarina]SNS89139.1 hypothetical protein SAMN05421775_103193 [Jannaschia aquimarina]
MSASVGPEGLLEGKGLRITVIPDRPDPDAPIRR